jgi:hypothetical protein
LVDRIRADPVAYFRFVNAPWIARVCEVFAGDVDELQVIRLHGDAHVEQFAVTQEAWGLDDFDDSARGSALVDIVRFLGSIDLVARQRGWTAERDALSDRFFAGYRKGLVEPGYRPPPPAIVSRLRVGMQRTRSDFLAWADTLVEPLAESSMQATVAAMDAIAQVVYTERPDLPRGYLEVVRAGWLRVGVGSAVRPKILIRIQGASRAPEDDQLVEMKQVRDLEGLPCLEAQATVQPTLRVILGTTQIGRLRHNILVAGPELVVPELVARGRELREWWMKSWDPYYRELRLDDLRSANDLAEIAYDAGVQLGTGSFKEEPGSLDRSDRERQLRSLARLEQRIRQRTSRLVDELLAGWTELHAGR